MTTKNLYQRILAVMDDISYIQKGDKKVNNQYTYVSHDAVSSAIHPLMIKHGILVLPSIKECKQEGNRTEVRLEVRFVNVDKPSEFIINDWMGYGIDAADKGPGKAVSYAFKYAILKTFCLATGDDPDHDQQVKYEAPTKNSLELLTYLIGDDKDYEMQLFNHFASRRGIKSLSELDYETFQKVCLTICKRNKLREEAKSSFKTEAESAQ